MGRLTIAGLIAALTLGTSVLVASAQPASFWPATTGEPVVAEWYSDIPWLQKLGTRDGNEIDVPLILPYAALGENETAFCTANKLSQPACMVETGVVNILGTRRTDTPYNPNDPLIRAKTYCQILPCIEVKLQLSSYRTPEHGQRNCTNGGSVRNGIRRPQLRGVRDHGGQHLPPANALVHGALLRSTFHQAT